MVGALATLVRGASLRSAEARSLRSRGGSRLRREGGVGAAALLLAASSAQRPGPFPGWTWQGRHGPDVRHLPPSARGAAVRLTREGWQDVIAKMVSLGAKGTDEELAAVLDYLSTNFKGDAPKPVNMNTAPAIDLESVAGLLRKEAAALIAYRTKHGPCKALDDLKKIPGVDFRKIDRRRDRLVCF